MSHVWVGFSWRVGESLLSKVEQASRAIGGSEWTKLWELGVEEEGSLRQKLRRSGVFVCA